MARLVTRLGMSRAKSRELPRPPSGGWRGRGRGRGRDGGQYNWRQTQGGADSGHIPTRHSHSEYHGPGRDSGSDHGSPSRGWRGQPRPWTLHQPPFSLPPPLLPTPHPGLPVQFHQFPHHPPSHPPIFHHPTSHPPAFHHPPTSHPPTSHDSTSHHTRNTRAHSSHHRVQSVHRPWVKVNQPLHVGGASATTLTVMTYNVLAQSLIEKNRDLYWECVEEELQWNTRRERLLGELSETKADIMCLQEVEEEHYHDWFQPRLSQLGYSGLYKKRTGIHSDGCAMFYKASRLKVVEWRAVEFQKGIKVLDRDNVGIVVRFQMSEKRESRNPAMFCVASTHLLFNPKAGDVKLAQLAFLLAELHTMASPQQGMPGLPCVLCGDMNSLPVSPLVRFIESGILDYSQLSGLQVAGYNKRGSNRRPIPVPLLPPDMAIGQDCRHHPPVTTDTSHTPTAAGGGGGDGTPSLGGDDPPVAVLSHPFTFSSAYPRPSPTRPPSTATTYHTSAFETVDYIHFTSSTGPTHSARPKAGARRAPFARGGGRTGFRLLSRRDLISAPSLLELGPQPHHLLPSDHLWLLACLQLIPP